MFRLSLVTDGTLRSIDKQIRMMIRQNLNKSQLDYNVRLWQSNSNLTLIKD